MKRLFIFCNLLALFGCQKELSFTNTKTAVITQVEVLPAKPDSAKHIAAKPNIDLVAFKEMLNENYQFQMIRYYSQTEDLWTTVPEWIKDDAYTFRETGEGWIDANTDQDPTAVFYGREQSWQAYLSNEDARLDWVDIHYEPVTYTIESFVADKSFTVSYTDHDIKLFAEYHIWE